MSSGGWNRLTNGQRDDLVKLPVWTTEADRRLALAYVHHHLEGVESAIADVRAGGPTPPNLGEIVAVARYESARWMPDGCFEQWSRWMFLGGAEKMSDTALVTWLGDVERLMRQEAQPGRLPSAPIDKERVRCPHLANSDEPGANLMPDPCPNCVLYYVNDDNSVEQSRADSSPAGHSATTQIEGASHRNGLGLSRSR